MKRPVLGVVAAALSTLSLPARADTWSFSGDFAVVLPQVGNGIGNAWWYERADAADLDADYPLFTEGNGSSYTFAPNAFHSISAGSVHPGTFNFSMPASNPEPDCIIEFRAPAAGTYTVSGFILDGNGSDSDGPLDGRGIRATISTSAAAGSDVGVAAFAAALPSSSSALLDSSNTNESMRVTLGGVNPLPTQANFDFVITMAAGQRLFFRINDLASNRFDGTSLTIDITDVVPVPDAGVPDAALPDAAPPDAAPPDAAAPLPDAAAGPPDAAPPSPDAATVPDDGSGCDCRTAGSRRTASLPFALVVAACVPLFYRRARARWRFR